MGTKLAVNKNIIGILLLLGCLAYAASLVLVWLPEAMFIISDLFMPGTWVNSEVSGVAGVLCGYTCLSLLSVFL
jgi:hypothetical protein